MVGQEVQLVVGAVVPGDRLPVQLTFAESYRHLVELVVAVEAVVAPAVLMKFDDDQIVVVVVVVVAVAVAVQQTDSSVI